MHASRFGRVVFGLSAVLFGTIALLWHDAETWQSVRSIWRLPLGDTIGAVLMVAQIAGGVGILLPRLTRWASTILILVFAVFSLACIPGMLKAPRVYAEYGSFFEQLAILCGAVALYATTQTTVATKNLLERAARVGLGVAAISFTLEQALYLRETAALVPAWLPPNQTVWAIVTTVAFAVAALAILIDRRARLAMQLTAVMIALFGFLVWVPLLVAHPQGHFAWSEFALTFLIAGAALTVSDSVGQTAQ